MLDEAFYAAMNSAMILYTASASGKSVRKLMYRHTNLNAQADSVSQVTAFRHLVGSTKWLKASQKNRLFCVPKNLPFE